VGEDKEKEQEEKKEHWEIKITLRKKTLTSERKHPSIHT